MCEVKYNTCISCFIKLDKYDIIYRNEEKIPCCPICWNELYEYRIAINNFKILPIHILDSDNDVYFEKLGTN